MICKDWNVGDSNSNRSEQFEVVHDWTPSLGYVVPDIPNPTQEWLVALVSLDWKCVFVTN